MFYLNSNLARDIIDTNTYNINELTYGHIMIFIHINIDFIIFDIYNEIII